MRFFLDFSYNGQHFHGWQRQINAISVQQTIEDCISIIQGDKTSISGAGRTDSGVHANQMFAHFDINEKINDKNSFIHKTNSFLPSDIAVKNVLQVEDDSHARFDALSREYEYHISLKKNPFEIDKSYLYKKTLDLNKMNKCCDILLQYTDFKSFSKSKTDVKTYDCQIFKAKWILDGDSLIFKIKADRFLRNMVRAIVGTLIEVGLGKINQKDFKVIIEKKDRQLAGFSVPAHGLYLKKIEYNWDKVLISE